jgi:transposase
MANTEIWERRVSEWKASGQTWGAYSKDKPFTAGGLRYWALRLQHKGHAPEADKPVVRIARILRGPAAEAPRKPSPEPVPIASAAAPEPLVVECGVMRVAVRPDFDRETLAAVLDVLASRGGAR